MTQATFNKSRLADIRKQNEFEDMMHLSAKSRFIKIRALDAGHGHPPTRYEIIYTCKGYYAPGKIAERFLVYLTLTSAYPTELPLFQYDPSTPIYHPNVFPEYSGTRHYICIGHDNRVVPGLPLRQYIIGVGHMIQHRKGYNLTPIDTRELVEDDHTPSGIQMEFEVENIPVAPVKETDIQIEVIDSSSTPPIDIVILTSLDTDQTKKPNDDSGDIDIVIF